jgi:hypothetical protein
MSFWLDAPPHFQASTNSSNKLTNQSYIVAINQSYSPEVYPPHFFQVEIWGTAEKHTRNIFRAMWSPANEIFGRSRQLPRSENMYHWSETIRKVKSSLGFVLTYSYVLNKVWQVACNHNRSFSASVQVTYVIRLSRIHGLQDVLFCYKLRWPRQMRRMGAAEAMGKQKLFVRENECSSGMSADCHSEICVRRYLLNVHRSCLLKRLMNRLKRIDLTRLMSPWWFDNWSVLLWTDIVKRKSSCISSREEKSS